VVVGDGGRRCLVTARRLVRCSRRAFRGRRLAWRPAAERYPADVEAAVYVCCLEALQNATAVPGDTWSALVASVPAAAAVVPASEIAAQ
jgi:hypothetical protein